MRKRIFVSLLALLTLNAVGMDAQKLSINTRHPSPFFIGVNQESKSNGFGMPRSNSCPTGLKIDQQHSEATHKKTPVNRRKKTLTRSDSESELRKTKVMPVKLPPRCRSTDSLFSDSTPNPIKRSFPCMNLECREKSIVFFCMRHCKDKTNVNNITHSQSAFNQFDIRAFNQSDVYLLKMIGELLRPNQVFGGCHSRHSITASLLGWELTQTPDLNEQNLGRLRGLPLSEVVKHHSFQKMISDANYSTDLEGESGNQELVKLKNLLNLVVGAFGGQSHVLIPLISSNCTINWLARLVTDNPELAMTVSNLGVFVFQFSVKNGVIEYVVDEQRKLKIFEPLEFLSFIFECPAFEPFINPTPLSNAEAMINYYNILENSSDNLQFIRELLNLLGVAGNANNNVIISNVCNMISQIHSSHAS